MSDRNWAALRNEFMKAASFIVCPMCDEEVCCGREKCAEIHKYIVKKVKENQDA